MGNCSWPRLLLGILLGIFLLPSQVLSDVSAGSQIAFQIRNGQFCGSVGKEELYSLFPEAEPVHDPNCEMSEIQKNIKNVGVALGKAFRNDPQDEIEDRVMEIAAKSQVQKDKCLVGVLDRLQESPNLQNTWSRQLSYSWVRLKKIRLIREKCERLFWNATTPVVLNLKGGDPVRAWEFIFERENSEKIENGVLWQNHFESETEKNQWKEQCLDSDKKEALMAAEVYTLNTVPLLNSKEFYDNIDNNRQLIKNLQTGEPVSDEDILSWDLSDWNAMSNTLDTSGLDSQNQRVAGRIRSQRQGLVNEFETILNNPEEPSVYAGQMKDSVPRLSQAQKDYLYQNGSVFEALDEKEMADYSPHLGQASHPTNAGVCMMSKYESSFAGEALDFALFGAFGGGLGMAYRVLNTGRKLYRLERALVSPVGSVMQGAFSKFTRDEIKGSSCLEHKTQFAKESMEPTTPRQQFIAANLPRESDSGAFQKENLTDANWAGPISNDLKQVLAQPSCEKEYGRVHNEVEQIPCWEAILASSLGLKSGLAFEFYRAIK